MRSPAWARRTFASLSNRNYAKFFTGYALSFTGTWMQSVALAWLVLQLTNSPALLGLVVALQSLPTLVIGPYAGVIVDRVNRRRLLMVTQTLGATQAILLAALTLTGHITYIWALVLTLMLGLINAFDMPGRQAFVREMVSVDEVRNAVSLNAVLMNAARAVGPAIGGLLIASFGVGTCFAVNALTYTGSIIAYLTMNKAELRTVPPTPRAKGQLREGLAYVRRSPNLLMPLLMMTIIGTLTYEFHVTLPSLAIETFGGNASSLGFLTGAVGVGAIFGGLTSASRPSVSMRTLIGSATAFGVMTLLTSLSPSVAVASAMLVGVGFASAWYMSSTNTALQLGADPHMRGRVMSLYSVAFIGTTPIGGPIMGVIAEAAGARWALGIGAAAALLAAVLGVTVMRRMSEEHRTLTRTT